MIRNLLNASAKSYFDSCQTQETVQGTPNGFSACQAQQGEKSGAVTKIPSGMTTELPPAQSQTVTLCTTLLKFSCSGSSWNSVGN